MAAPLLAAGAASLPAGAAGIELVDDGRSALVVEVRGLEPERLDALERTPPARWPDLFAVRTAEASLADPELPPLLGAYSVGDGAVRFTPRFPLAAGTTYVARWTDPGDGRRIEARFTVPRPELPSSTTLRGVYPSVPRVPENLLRIYLQFSAPMSRGRAHEHIRLVDERGEVVAGAFVAPERELWSPDGTRLTLFFDPGRIKRGVGPNAEVGPPLRAGERYRLEIDHELADARGVPLVRDYYKGFEVAPPDREQPRTDEWRLEPPAGPLDAVRLSVPEPLDRALLEGLLTVLDAAGSPVEGEATVHPGESAWSFLPADGWGDGVYRIRVPTILEDLAGNSLRRPFEVVLEDAAPRPETGDEIAYLDLPFAVR